ncbi:hypothetical protein [Candidatus Amarobacter glycogenicus]|uniref:hypothetical protein n=1 Tax=Candidatus Amarobacter glycogenicus TaxID=3140699 RepID=UPI0031CCD83D
MRITTDNRRKPGRLAALLMVTLLAAMVAIGYRVQTAEAIGCTFKFARGRRRGRRLHFDGRGRRAFLDRGSQDLMRCERRG